MKRKTVPVALAVVSVLVAGILLRGIGHDSYTVEVSLASANGLREGTVVKIAGAQVGTISELRLTAGDKVVAELELRKDKTGPVREGASARILSSNLIGSKYLDLDPGRRNAPTITRIPRARVQQPVDLDQVLNVLDADTRARLQILINETGYAVAGRRADFSAILRFLPRDITAANRLLEQVTADNRSLGEATRRASGFVARVAHERRDLGTLVDRADRTFHVTAAQRAALESTLRQAPDTLDQARGFLTDLERTARPLKPAARAIAQAAAPLSQTLQALPAFERQARPAVRTATTVAPRLAQLGAQGAPVIRRAGPVARDLATLATTSRALSRTLDVSIDDVLGLIEGWARSIQEGDSLGHIFRGKAVVTADALKTLLDHEKPATRRRQKRPTPRPSVPAAIEKLAEKTKSSPSDKPVEKLATTVGDTLSAITGAVTDALSGNPKRGDQPASNLLDYLLGK